MTTADPLSSPPFRLLVACARWPRGALRDAGVRQAADLVGENWPAFVAMVRRHRMAPLALDGLTCAGIDPPAELKALATNDVRRVLGLCAEAGRLGSLFAAAGIPMAMMKGPGLSALLYDTASMRQCKDLDLWIDPDNVPHAWDLLRTAGYELVKGPPAAVGPWLDLWLRSSKDLVVQHATNGSIIELHHRLNTNPHVMASLKVADATREARLGAGKVRTLDEPDQFAYLCTHGTVSRWFRLKWLADIQAIVSRLTPEEISELYEAARQRGAARPAGLALRLCGLLWNVELTERLASALRRDRSLVLLERDCISRLIGPAYIEHDSVPAHVRFTMSMKEQIYDWRVSDSPAYRVWMIRNIWVDWELMRRLPLPRPLHFLYPFLRPMSWAWRKFNVSRIAQP